MNLLIIISSIIVYACVGAVVCGIYDEFFIIDSYILFWPFIVIIKTAKSFLR